MNYKDIPPMTPERWIANLIEAAWEIADKEKQERRWLAPDAYAWERPEELICSFFDDCVFDGFLKEHVSSFSDEQDETAFALLHDLDHYCDETPQYLDPAKVLADPRWDAIRRQAAAFAAAFKDKWPSHSEGVVRPD